MQCVWGLMKGRTDRYMADMTHTHTHKTCDCNKVQSHRIVWSPTKMIGKEVSVLSNHSFLVLSLLPGPCISLLFNAQQTQITSVH